MRSAAAPLRLVSLFAAFDRILGIDTPVRILRLDGLSDTTKCLKKWYWRAGSVSSGIDGESQKFSAEVARL
jgi:hypothetical protein